MSRFSSASTLSIIRTETGRNPPNIFRQTDAAMEELIMARDCNETDEEERPYVIESDEKEGRYMMRIS